MALRRQEINIEFWLGNYLISSHIKDKELGENTIKMNHREIPKHPSTSLALKMVTAAFTETLLLKIMSGIGHENLRMRIQT